MRHATRNGSGALSLDLRPIGKEKMISRFPQAHELVRTVAGLDITKEPVPIRPVAHRPMGGIETKADGATAIPGLFAVGECACNGLNGAGRLAGNTLTEAVLFGRKVGEAAAGYAKSAPVKGFPGSKLSDEEKRLAALVSGKSAGDSAGKIHSELGSLMNEKVGLVRDGAGLSEALARIQELKERCRKIKIGNLSRIYNYALTSTLELGSMLNLAEIVALSAQARNESRGAHRRADFPERDDQNWSCHSVVSLAQGAAKLEKRPVAGAG
jgi:succinate dehydrogenase/fumarate reductase flavoprotein subunit